MDESYNKALPKIPEHVLQDLCSRFLINIPEQEKNDMVRICFQIELAHWYYIDFFRQNDQDLPVCGMKDFITIIFSEFKFLNKSKQSIQKIYENWKQYKVRVPVYGAILLDESLEKCLLVQGYHNKTSWGFPKGKINKDEPDIDCAIREVWEEVGYDIKPLVKSDQFLENNIHDHQVRLYIVAGVKEDYPFQPNTRGEIKDIKWFNINVLPTHKRDPTPKDEIGLMANNFFMIHTFIRPLRKWVNEKKESMNYQPYQHFHAMERSFKPIYTQPKVTTNKWSMEDNDELKKRREKEAEDFKRMHMLMNPLGSSKSDEDALKSLLGVQAADERRTPTHMEPFRKLLNGTVEISPLKPSDKSKQRNNNYPVNHENRSPLNYYTDGGTRRDDKKYGQPRLNKNSKDPKPKTLKDASNDTSNTPNKKKQSYTNRNAVLFQNVSNQPKQFMKKQRGINKSPRTNAFQEKCLSNFEFSAPAFMEFRFDYKRIMAAV